MSTILGISGSLRRGSYNSMLLRAAAELAPAGTTVEIASILCYSERTVKGVIHGITSRLQLRNRSHAVAYALRNALI